MAGLTSNFIGVVIQFHTSDRKLWMGSFGMATDTAGRGGRLAGCTIINAVRIIHRHIKAAAGPLVFFLDMAGGTGEIQTIRGHMHINRFIRIIKRRGQIAVFHVIAATAVKMTIATIVTAGHAHGLGC